MPIITVDNLTTWRQYARQLLKRSIPPEHIHWQCNAQNALTFDDSGDFLQLPIQHKQLAIPKPFIALAEKVACYRCDSRWPLLYSLAWRVLFEDRKLLNMPIDPQVSKAMNMRKAISRDKHKMEAFIRFQRIAPDQANYADHFGKDDEYYVAWFEPDHFILPITANFFIKRFTNMSWSILTPDGCAHWNQKTLTFTEGLHKRPSIDDKIETLWLTYYSHIFNPARVKLKAMQSEMPKKYWVNLPEAPLIKELTRSAGHRVDKMIHKAPNKPWKKTQKSKYVKEKQGYLQAPAKPSPKH